MPNYSPAIQAALRAGVLVYRDFIWIVARDREDNSPVPVGLWSDVYNDYADVIDAYTGAVESRYFEGAGSLISVSDIISTVGVSVDTVTITVSQLHDRVAELIRQYDAQQARIDIYRAFYNAETNTQIEEAVSRFTGFIDFIDENTGAEGEESTTEITCTSHTQEALRSNPDTRSDSSQRIRDPDDNFFEGAETAHELEVFWGTQSGKAKADKKGGGDNGGFGGLIGTTGIRL